MCSEHFLVCKVNFHIHDHEMYYVVKRQEKWQQARKYHSAFPYNEYNRCFVDIFVSISVFICITV